MEFTRDLCELKEVYVNLLIEYAKKDERICIVESDLMRSGGTMPFGRMFPERTFDVGIAEADMMCIAAGLSYMGKIPFTQTFCVFATRRCLDQIEQSVAYAKQNVKICGTDPGITTELNGGTHESMDDMGIMRAIPGMTIFEPVDGNQLKKIFPQILNQYGPCYIRLFRPAPYTIFDENTEFTLGRGTVLKEGGDVTILAGGVEVADALNAWELLKAEGVNAEVINIHTLKPLDTELIIKSVSKTGCAVTAENGSIINGLGSAVAECLVEHRPVPLKRIGVRDRFGEIGHLEELKKVMGMTSDDIVLGAKEVIERRGSFENRFD